jgi:hypothetical protein
LVFRLWAQFLLHCLKEWDSWVLPQDSSRVHLALNSMLSWFMWLSNSDYNGIIGLAFCSSVLLTALTLGLVIASYFLPWKLPNRTGHRWLTSVILATREAEIRKIMARSQPGPIVCKAQSQNSSHTHTTHKKNWWSGWRHRPWVQTSVPLKKKLPVG